MRLGVTAHGSSLLSDNSQNPPKKHANDNKIAETVPDTFLSFQTIQTAKFTKP
jgi:hypothetical protein